MRNRGTAGARLTRRAVPWPLPGMGSPQALVGAGGTPQIKRSSLSRRGYHCKLQTRGTGSGDGVESVRLGDGQSARPKPLRWGCCRASRVAAPLGWQQGKKPLSPRTELATTPHPQRQRGSAPPGSPQPGCEPLPGPGKQILGSRGIPPGPGGSPGAFRWGLASRSSASTFPTATKMLSLAGKTTFLSTLCPQSRAAGIPAGSPRSGDYFNVP